jgi:predicted metal-dependent hydrolase
VPAAESAQRGAENARTVIERTVEHALGTRVELELTQNRRTMISVRRVSGGLRLRLHEMFLEADDAILTALIRFLDNGDRRALRQLNEFIDARRARAVGALRRPALRTTGRCHDLAEIFDDLERRYFPGALEGVAVTWGRHVGRRGWGRKRTIRLGSYNPDQKLIRVHPVLDQAWVPRFFVEYIVFHEMLHHVEPARRENRRTVFHTSEFRRRERTYPGFARALAWERKNIEKLLRF